MCGIWLYLHKPNKRSLTYCQMYDAFMQTDIRGPDRSLFLKQSNYGVYIGFHRLSIMDLSTKGDQPFVFEDDSHIVYAICNGEIYNFKNLCYKYEIYPESGSDCEIFTYLYERIGIDGLVKELLGEFAFCICDINKSTSEVKLFIGRDQAGIRPIFVTGNDDEIVLTSELKGSPFLEQGLHVQQFPPRHYLQICSTDEKLYDPSLSKSIKFRDFDSIQTSIYDLEEAKKLIRETLIESVRSRMVSDRPLGCLLSGGLDSSLVASIASDFCKENGQLLNTFSIGMEGSTDEYYAKLVAKHIGSKHTHVVLPESDWLNAIKKIINIIESYDITSVRASTGQYLICKWIAEHTNIKVLLIGDGSDELCAGYMYFHKAPNARAVHDENLRLVNDIHMYDVLRADRGISSNGLEGRVPFLDNRFIELYLSIDPELRKPNMGLEKWLLREAFTGRYLPEEVRLRPKEAFSDGVSSIKRSWYSILQEYINNAITDKELETAQLKYDHCKPPSKEALYFRIMFEERFGSSSVTAKVIPYFWLPKWVGVINEPSARILEVYKK